MSNSLTTNPIVIDATANSAVAKVLNIQAIVWAANSDHAIIVDNELKITNTKGDVLLQIEQRTAGKELIINFPRGFQTAGINVVTLGGGEVFIYLCGHSD
jgi:hypothetical protein